MKCQWATFTSIFMLSSHACFIPSLQMSRPGIKPIVWFVLFLGTPIMKQKVYKLLCITFCGVSSSGHFPNELTKAPIFRNCQWIALLPIIERITLFITILAMCTIWKFLAKNRTYFATRHNPDYCAKSNSTASLMLSREIPIPSVRKYKMHQ